MRMLLLAAAVLPLLLLPFTASADSPKKVVTYATAYHLIHPNISGGDYTGRLTLRFYADGVVNGIYRDDWRTATHSVAGGYKGTSIWLSFGAPGRQFNGTIHDDGRITGTLTHWQGPNVYEFTARPVSP